MAGMRIPNAMLAGTQVTRIRLVALSLLQRFGLKSERIPHHESLSENLY
jgi:hypothetical protein